jgi:hypothetical protein
MFAAKKIILTVFFTAFLFLQNSCGLKDYFRDPDTGSLSEAIHTTALVGYAADVAMAVMNGHSFSNVVTSGVGNDFPRSTLMVIDLSDHSQYPFFTENVSSMTVAALWADSETAILTILLTDYHAATTTFDLVGIETIPVIREGNHIRLALASMDIRLNPDESSLLSVNLTTGEVQTELLRLDETVPGDVYVAVKENAYFVDVDNQGTDGNLNDDAYTVSGGGQLVCVNKSTTQIVQQAMVDVKISNTCDLNPTDGMALVKVTGLESQGFPELGTVVYEFHDDCDGRVKVFAATGMYAGSNGKKIDFDL